MRQIYLFQMKALQQMTKELKSVSFWFKVNVLFISIDKTK